MSNGCRRGLAEIWLLRYMIYMRGQESRQLVPSVPGFKTAMIYQAL
jgi:hypothetical protein